MSRRPTSSRARLHADHPAVAWIVAGSVAMVAGTAMAMSFAGLAGVVGWTGLPDWARWTLPIALDGGMVAFTFAAFARRAEGRSAAYQWAMVILATAVSATANASHVALPTMPQAKGAQVIVGASLMAFVPVWAALSAHQVADLVAPARPEPTPARRPVAAVVTDTPALSAASVAAAPALLARPRATARPTAPRPVLDDAAKAEARQEAARLAAEGLSQRQIAERLGASKSSVARWLSSEAVTV